MIDALLHEALCRVARSSHLLLCLDFDGTLAEIVPNPEDARLLPGIQDLLGKLCGYETISVAILSGRTLADLRQVTHLPDAIDLIGSHGREFSRRLESSLWAPPLPHGSEYHRQVAELCDALEPLLAVNQGAMLELKTHSVALHYRRLDEAKIDNFLRSVNQYIESNPGLYILPGKKVIEFSFVELNKGEALSALRSMHGQGATVLYIGDDLTDELAFSALLQSDLGIKVGEGRSLAMFRVANPTAVCSVLQSLHAFLDRA